MNRRGLQAALVLLGAVALCFGVLGVLTGASLLSGGDTASASVDSELRFYAAWYAGAGLLLLATVRRVESEGKRIRAVCAVLLLAAIGRVLSIADVGRPHVIQLLLMVIEFAIPVIVVPWQILVARRVGADS